MNAWERSKDALERCRCETCKGYGEIDEKQCPDCKGSGMKKDKEYKVLLLEANNK